MPSDQQHIWADICSPSGDALCLAAESDKGQDFYGLLASHPLADASIDESSSITNDILCRDISGRRTHRHPAPAVILRDEPDCKMTDAAVHQRRTFKAGALSPAFTAPAEFGLDNHSPASALSELDGSLEFDGLGLGPELQYLLDTHLAESPMHSDSHLLHNMDKVGASVMPG